jgi:ABC-type Fe3+/spermidine/putrescine transport system ATPase subunit
MRGVIKELQQKLGMTTVYVTHDQEEALALSDRIIVMRNGQIEQEGHPLEIYNTPRTPFVADFVGAANIFKGRLLTKSAGGFQLEAQGGIRITCASAPHALFLKKDAECAVSVRSVYPKLQRSYQDGELNTWPCTIRRRIFLGDNIVYTVSWGDEELEVRTLPGDLFEEGESVFVHIDPNLINLLETEGE